MYTMLLYAALTAALFYLGSRALVTQWLWSKYPPKLAKFMDCSACTGAWYGAAVSLTVGYHYNLSYLGLDGRDWATPIVVGACSIALGPIAAGLMQWGLDHVGHVVTTEDDL